MTRRLAGTVLIEFDRFAWRKSTRLAAVLEQKAGRYGDLEAPFVLALCCGGTFVDWEDIVSAPYGEPAFAIGDDGLVTAFREPSGLFCGRGQPTCLGCADYPHAARLACARGSPSPLDEPERALPVDG